MGAKVYKLLDRVPEIRVADDVKYSKEKIELKKHIEFKDVVFRYPTAPDS